jgi:prephenate dehydrogenase
MINRLVIIGVGLIGGSLAQALKRAGYCRHITGCGRNEAHLRRAVELGVVDDWQQDIATAVRGADMVVLAVPLGAMEENLQVLAGAVDDACIITDVGSAKASVVSAARTAFGDLPENFVPGHPIAGTERSGVDASFAELFDGRRVILTPTERSSVAAVQYVTTMWQQAGAIVERMDCRHHDEILAATSHLPHMLAYVLVDALVHMDESEEIFRFAAGGFRDFTRIASSDPVMWHDICFANRDAVLLMLDRFRQHLDQLAAAIQSGDSRQIKDTFIRAKQARDGFVDQLSDPHLSTE